MSACTNEDALNEILRKKVSVKPHSPHMKNTLNTIKGFSWFLKNSPELDVVHRQRQTSQFRLTSSRER